MDTWQYSGVPFSLKWHTAVLLATLHNSGVPFTPCLKSYVRNTHPIQGVVVLVNSLNHVVLDCGESELQIGVVASLWRGDAAPVLVRSRRGEGLAECGSGFLKLCNWTRGMSVSVCVRESLCACV